MKKIVEFVTPCRGFMKHLFVENNVENWAFIDQQGTFEVSTKWHLYLSKIVRWKIWNYIGLIQVINFSKGKGEVYGSFNRFIKSNKPYFIYLENPTALYHYTLNRNNTIIGQYKIKKYLQDPNLKAIVCFSNACRDTFDVVCAHNIEYNFQVVTIYPFVRENLVVSRAFISKRCNEKIVKLLFVARGSRFISKGGLEVIGVMERIALSKDKNILLTIVTSVSELDETIKKQINRTGKIRLVDFKLTYDEMEQLYSEHTILLHPTSDDSSALTIMEAMKAGLPILTTNLYAIPEMVQDGVNGFLTDPKWHFFDKNNIPNPKVWDNRKKTIYSKLISQSIIDFLFKKIMELYENRDLLENLSLNSYSISNSVPFDRKTISEQWKTTLEKICE